MSNCFQSMGALGDLSGTFHFTSTPKSKPVSAPAPMLAPLTYSETFGVSHRQALPDTTTLVSAPPGHPQNVSATALAQAEANAPGMFDNLPIIPIAIGLVALLLLTKK